MNLCYFQYNENNCKKKRKRTSTRSPSFSAVDALYKITCWQSQSYLLACLFSSSSPPDLNPRPGISAVISSLQACAFFTEVFAEFHATFHGNFYVISRSISRTKTEYTLISRYIYAFSKKLIHPKMLISYNFPALKHRNKSFSRFSSLKFLLSSVRMLL